MKYYWIMILIICLVRVSNEHIYIRFLIPFETTSCLAERAFIPEHQRKQWFMVGGELHSPKSICMHLTHLKKKSISCIFIVHNRFCCVVLDGKIDLPHFFLCKIDCVVPCISSTIDFMHFFSSQSILLHCTGWKNQFFICDCGDFTVLKKTTTEKKCWETILGLS